VLSVPFGSRFVEQVRLGFSGAVRGTGDRLPYFFQRIYDSEAFKRRVLDPATGLDQVTLTTVTRDKVWLSRGFGSLNENFRGLLGVLNPLLSMSINRCSKGMDSNFTCHYGEFHKSQDVYGDLVLSGRKKLPSI